MSHAKRDAPVCVLYRIFDADGVLLYVGATTNPKLRFATHARSQSWWGQAATITLTHFSQVNDLMAAERQAIEEESPKYNFVYSGKQAPWAHKPRQNKGRTVFQRADGYWVAGVELPPGPNGKRRVKRFVSVDRSVAVARLDAYEAAHDSAKAS